MKIIPQASNHILIELKSGVVISISDQEELGVVIRPDEDRINNMIIEEVTPEFEKVKHIVKRVIIKNVIPGGN